MSVLTKDDGNKPGMATEAYYEALAERVEMTPEQVKTLVLVAVAELDIAMDVIDRLYKERVQPGLVSRFHDPELKTKLPKTGG